MAVRQRGPAFAMHHAFLGPKRESVGLAAPQGQIDPMRFSTARPSLFAPVYQGQALQFQSLACRAAHLPASDASRVLGPSVKAWGWPRRRDCTNPMHTLQHTLLSIFVKRD